MALRTKTPGTKAKHMPFVKNLETLQLFEYNGIITKICKISRHTRPAPAGAMDSP